MYNGQCITGCHKRILIAQYFIRFMLKGAMTGVTSTSSFMPRTAAVPREACEINLTNHPNFSVGSSLLFIRSVYVINLNLKSFLLAQLQIIYCKNIHGNILKWYFLFHASISITIYNWWEYIHTFILSYLITIFCSYRTYLTQKWESLYQSWAVTFNAKDEARWNWNFHCNSCHEYEY